jgi:two-component system NtrC family sensor kinase
MSKPSTGSSSSGQGPSAGKGKGEKGTGRAAGASLPQPSTAEFLEGLTTLGRELHLEMEEKVLVERFMSTLGRLFPERRLAVRVLDPRSVENARVYTNHAVRAHLEGERITVKRTSVAKTRLKSAVTESARIKIDRRWDSPFPDTALGFTVPLVASGELYGVLDIGYPLGCDRGNDDEPLILPIANQFSVALRNERLHRETSVLRDYQAKLIEHANALILGVDRHWRITVCNQALCSLTGYSHSDVIGRDLRDWLPEGQRQGFTRLFIMALSGGTTDAMDINLMTKSGQQVRTVWSVAAISGQRQQVEAVVAIGQDQTKLRELQSQVIQAEKLATLGQLAAGVVHELNNPLTSITVYTEFLLRKAEAALERAEPVLSSDGDIEKLRRINSSAQRILEFSRDLVQYAAPAGDELDIVAINHVAKLALSFCEHLFDKAGVELIEELDAELPPVYAVPGQLEQVVINLVTNAIQATERGGRVLVATFLDAPGEVGFAVADSGPGIAADDRERIFEPFYTTKTDGRGTGLGLSIVRNIVKQHKGDIELSEGSDGGAKFKVVIPAAD